MEPLLPSDPKKLGVWTLTGRLGKGGMGAVYMAHNKERVTVAIKVISGIKDERIRDRFKQEIQALSLIKTPYVARLYDYDYLAKNPWYASEYVSDMSLRDVIQTTGSFTGERWWNLAQHLLIALEAIHDKGVIHRDLKPDNVMIVKSEPKLIDFGLAKPVANFGGGAAGTTRTELAGTPQYMSPEQWGGLRDVDEKTDIWAIGITLIDAAGGRAWGEMNQGQIKEALRKGKLPDLSKLDVAQRALVTNMVKFDPDERLSAEVLRKGLMEYFNTRPAPAAAQVKVEAKPIVVPNNIKVEGNRVVVQPNDKFAPKARKVAKNPYVTSDGVPIFIGMRVKYIKTEELGRVTKLDKNDTGYVFVQLDGENESKVKSTNQLLSAAGIRKEKIKNFEPSFIRRNWKDLLLFWLITPPGWLIFKYFTDKEFMAKFSSSKSPQTIKYWKIAFLVIHATTFGLFGPMIGIPLAIKMKRLLLTIFAVANLAAVWIFLVGIANTPDGGTLPTFPTMAIFLNYLGGFFIPLFLRMDKTTQAKHQDSPEE
jgi:serine/threonine protein kinase